MDLNFLLNDDILAVRFDLAKQTNLRSEIKGINLIPLNSVA